MRAQFSLFAALRHCSITTLIVLLDLVRLGRDHLPISARAGGGESVPPEATGAVPGEKVETEKSRRFHSLDHGYPQPDVCVA